MSKPRSNFFWVYQTDGAFIPDTHTANGIHVARGRDLDVPTVAFATAAPVKVEEYIEEAIGFAPPRDPRFRSLEEQVKNKRNPVVHNSPEAMRAYFKAHFPKDVYNRMFATT